MITRTNSLLLFALSVIAGIGLAYAFPFSAIYSLLIFSGVLLLAFLLFYREKLSPANRFLFLLTVAFLWGQAVFSLDDFRKSPGLSSEAETYCGTVCESKAIRHGRQQLFVELQGIFDGDELLPRSEKVLLTLADTVSLLKAGDNIAFTGSLKPIVNRGNPGEFDAELYYLTKKIRYRLFCTEAEVLSHEFSLAGVFSKWQSYLSAILDRFLEGDARAVGKAILLGDKSDMDQELMQSFSATGTTHVLAVSGLHVGLILLMLQRVLVLFHRILTRRSAIILSILLIIAYGLLTGASPSVMRAVTMFSILSLAQLLRRKNDPVGALSFAAIVQLSWNPWYLFDLGFQLSYLALLGIFLLYPFIEAPWSPKRKLIRVAWRGTAAGVAATLFTAPVVLYNFHRFPNYFVLANLGIMVLGFLVLSVGIIFLVTSFIPLLSKLTALVFSVTVVAMVLWVKLIDSIPGAVSAGFQLSLLEVFVAFVIIIFWFIHLSYKKFRRISLLLITGCFVLFISVNRWMVLNSNELVVLNANQFCMILRKGNVSYAFYGADRNGSWKLPSELKNYAAFTGSKIVPLKFQGRFISGKIGKEKIALNRQKEGIDILFRGRKLFYRQKGIPGMSENPALFSPEERIYVQAEEGTVFRWIY